MGKLLLGNCLETMKTLPDNSVDSIVTDPPYGLSFMGKAWDYDVPTVAIWKECLRVLKPGGHLLAFGGTRTYHRLVVAIEDAGFEIRDQIQWIYGSGFPKSMDISKAIDKEAGAERTPTGRVKAGHAGFEGTGKAGSLSATEGRDRPWMHDPEKANAYHMETAPSTDDAKKWSGYGTALKPANEPICLARKPLSEKTVAKNVLKHGTGGINIKASRIGFTSEADKASVLNAVTGEQGYEHHAGAMTGGIKRMDVGSPDGRFPANILFDEYAAESLDIQAAQNVSRFFYVAKSSKKDRNQGLPEGFATWENLDQSRVDQAAKLSEHLRDMFEDTTPPQDDAEWGTFLFGSSTTDLSLLGMTYTTKTKSKMITASTILSALANLTTKESIQDVIEMITESGSSPANSAESINSSKLNTISELTEYRLGAVLAVLQMLSPVRKLNGNAHSTVKPIKLMEYLIKLVTPEGGTVLDPFMGSGTTGVAARQQGFDFIGCEMDTQYFEIAKTRIIATLKDVV